MAVLLLLLGAVLLPIIYYKVFHPLAGVPGPFLASVSRLWLIGRVRAGDMPQVMIKLHQKHGPLVRTGPNEVSVADLDAVQTIYSPGSKFRKSDWYSIWQGHRKFDLFGERDEAIHSEQRRLVSSTYSKDSLHDLEPVVDDAIRLLLSKLGDGVVDLRYWVQLFAFDVIGGVTFSKFFGFMEAGRDDGSFQAILDAHESGAWIGQVPALFWLNDWLTPWIGNRLKVNNRHLSLRDVAVREIAAREARKGNEKDILSKLWTMEPTSRTSMVTSNIFAGSDTTSIAIRAIIYYLLRNPESKAKLMEELGDAKNLSLAEAEAMPYLQAVIYEALRLHPPIGLSLARVAPAGGIVVAGKFVPENTVIGANAWVINRLPVFGEAPDEFRPERWLEGVEKRYFLSFGGGSRMCLGRNISWMEMAKLVPALFREFDMELVSGEWSTTCWWFVQQDKLDVRMTRRSKS